MRLRKLSNILFYIFVISLFTIPVFAFLRIDTSMPTVIAVATLSILILLSVFEAIKRG